VLHQFPLEANIAAHFTMLDPRMEETLFAEARRDMITGAVGDGRRELAEAFATVLERGGEFGLDQLLSEIVDKRDGLRRFIDAMRFGVGASDRPLNLYSRSSGFRVMIRQTPLRHRSGLFRIFRRISSLMSIAPPPC
jgi:hypothetical protein